MFSHRIFDLIFFCWDHHQVYHKKSKTAKSDKISFFTLKLCLHLQFKMWGGIYIKYISEERKYNEVGKGHYRYLNTGKVKLGIEPGSPAYISAIITTSPNDHVS
jgi:hypothetical protein